MIYVDKNYYDFLIPIKSDQKERPQKPIKVECMSKSEEKIKFKIRKGEWRKSREADYIISLIRDRVYFGWVPEINDYLQRTICESIKKKSFKSGGPGPNNLACLRRSPLTLERKGLLTSICASQTPILERLIIADYEKRPVS